MKTVQQRSIGKMNFHLVARRVTLETNSMQEHISKSFTSEIYVKYGSRVWYYKAYS